MRRIFAYPGSRLIFTLCIFAVLATAILTRAPKWMGDFDQSFYLTIAYDIDRYGVFSNGMFDQVNSVDTAPPPGMFIAPMYPWLVLAVQKIDPRFARAAKCSVEANHDRRDRAECDVYALPMHLIHALLLALGALAIGRTAELIFGGRATFWLAASFATVALLPDAELFSFVMTESLTFFMFSVTMLALVKSWITSRWQDFAIAGVLLGLLCLTRTSFLILAPVLVVLILINTRLPRAAPGVRTPAWQGIVAFAVCFGLMVVPWAIRNSISVGKFAMTEEYGSAAIVERFAFNQMTPQEYALAFPHCLPFIGPCIVAATVGEQATARFTWDSPGSFFELGRGARGALLKLHDKLDPIIGDIVRAELSANWWRHILVSIPLAWCGLWVGGLFGLFLAPAFVWAGLSAIRRRKPLFLMYAVPALTMLALHAGLANHYTRYNLILIGPFAAGAAWLIARSGWLSRVRWRWRARAPAP